MLFVTIIRNFHKTAFYADQPATKQHAKPCQRQGHNTLITLQDIPGNHTKQRHRNKRHWPGYRNYFS